MQPPALFQSSTLKNIDIREKNKLNIEKNNEIQFTCILNLIKIYF